VCDAARVVAAVYYANKHRFPTTFDEMTAGRVLDLRNVTLTNDTTVTGSSWTLTMQSAGTKAPVFVCAPR
jgi:hypothetical protein